MFIVAWYEGGCRQRFKIVDSIDEAQIIACDLIDEYGLPEDDVFIGEIGDIVEDDETISLGEILNEKD